MTNIENDPRISSLILELADYTPVAIGRKWSYSKRMGTRKFSNNIEIVDVTGNRFLVKIDTEVSQEWYREGEYFISFTRKTNNTERTLRYPIRLNSTWTNQVQNVTEQYKITDVGQVVNVAAGTFKNCIKVLVQSSPTEWKYIYYAPDVGKIKQESIRQSVANQTQVVFEEELTSFDTP